jgi:hypothetical protein
MYFTTLLRMRRLIGNGFIIVSLHEFAHPLRWYNQLYNIKKYDFGLASNDIASIPNLIQIRPTILELCERYRWV